MLKALPPLPAGDVAGRHRMLIARQWQLLARVRQAGLPVHSALEALEGLTRINDSFNQAVEREVDILTAEEKVDKK